MRVKATRIGYYGNKRQKEGEQFVLKSEKDFSKTWMEKVTGGKASKAAEAEKPAAAAQGSSSSEVI